ncbi:MAG: AAA family ATPase, partial [Erysipelotrichaceae bacterium]|nr:AAA family ATPase [Erysipelotrichaceae bacterium]
TMTDVIFSGSADRRPVGMAEVTLVFDNSQHFLHTQNDEVEITRRLYRSTGQGDYFINRVPCRLKDIVELILDTGLGKDSLSMISQGNISSFAEAKPVDRRGIFEEAAGVSKYKKRKIESLGKLERTKNNLDRTNDILTELERQVTPLKRQAHKAEIYREKKARLEKIEIAVLVEDIASLNQNIEETDKTLFDIETETTMKQMTIEVHETQNEENRKELRRKDERIQFLQDELMHVVNEIQILETRKIEIDEKRKYAIEMGSSEEKLKELTISVEEARIEYEDRKQRFEMLNTEIDLLTTRLTKTALKIAEASSNAEQQSHLLRKYQNRRDVLENIIRQPFTSQAGVKAVMDNKNALKGVMGVAGQNLKAMDGYEEAISVALGGAMMNIVTTDEAAARNAIGFLKRNQSGRATFLPCSVLRPRELSMQQKLICESAEGYLGVASEFVTCCKEFDIVNRALLQNVVVTDNLEHGNEIASLTNHTLKIVTLDGDVIHKGGSMTGGKVKNSTSLVTAEKEFNQMKQSILSQSAAVTLADQALAELKRERNNTEQQLMSKRIQHAQLEPVLDAKRAKYERLKNDMEMIGPLDNESSFHEESFADQLIHQLNEAYGKRDETTAAIKITREERLKLSAESERKEQQIRQMRKELDRANESKRLIEIDRAKLTTKLDSVLERLASEYQMTFEFAKTQVMEEKIENAREEVSSLRHEIEALGNVNMNAPEEYSEVNERYEFMKKQMDDLIASRDKILNAIDEMDDVMKRQFKDMFDKINAELNDTFRALFGGGKAKLILEDPNDLLNTGIDIDVQPPGKQVQNIRLFSGGEKSLIAICVLFSILKVRPVPLCIFDEVEAALDQGNVERFARYLKNFSEQTQFIVVTHRPGTMEQCDVLYGVTMQKQGVSQMLKVHLTDAIDLAEESEANA